MDLSTLDTTTVAQAGAKMDLMHPANGSPILQSDGSPVSITLAGQDSDRFRKADRAVSNRRLASGQRMKLTAEGIDADSLQRLVACTVAWNGISWDGAERECTPENAREAYTRFPWMREQAEAFIADRANFLKA